MAGQTAGLMVSISEFMTQGRQNMRLLDAAAMSECGDSCGVEIDLRPEQLL